MTQTSVHARFQLMLEFDHEIGIIMLGLVKV